jgi:hypothetical protein
MGRRTERRPHVWPRFLRFRWIDGIPWPLAAAHALPRRAYSGAQALLPPLPTRMWVTDRLCRDMMLSSLDASGGLLSEAGSTCPRQFTSLQWDPREGVGMTAEIGVLTMAQPDFPYRGEGDCGGRSCGPRANGELLAPICKKDNSFFGKPQRARCAARSGKDELRLGVGTS